MNDLLKSAYDPETFRRQGHALVDMLADHLTGALQRQPEKTIEWMAPETAAAVWELGETGEAPVAPEDLFRKVLEGGIKLHHPRYMGHQVSPPLPLPALAGLLNDFLNNGMGVFEMGIPGTAMERAVIRSVARKIGFDEGADGILTSGGTLANLTALLAARSVRAERNIWKEGSEGQLALMVSEEAHYCVDRAARIMGWGEAGVIKVPSDTRFSMRTELLEPMYQEARARGVEVIAVVGSACTTSTGSFDDLQAIGEFAQRHGLWFHVDGAHGAACMYAPKYRHLVAGMELADSVVMDFHKMLLSPTITTALVFRDGAHSFRTFSQKAEYLLSPDGTQDWHNLAKRTFETTKTMMSIRAYSMLQVYGEELFETYVTQVNDRCADFATLLQTRPGWELAAPPSCNILCFRHVPPGLPETEISAHNAAIRQRLVEQGRFYIVQTTLRGKLYLRVTLTNPFTTLDDLQELLVAAEKS